MQKYEIGSTADVSRNRVRMRACKVHACLSHVQEQDNQSRS